MQRDDLVRLRRARDRMDRDYAEPLDVPALAAEALMSTGHFHRSFKEAYGETPYAHLMTRRVERAAALLRRATSRSRTSAWRSAVPPSGRSSARFTELMGVTPSEYRARSHEERAASVCVAKQRDGRPRRAGRSGSEKREGVAVA